MTTAEARLDARTFVEAMIHELRGSGLNASAVTSEVSRAAVEHFASKPATASLPALAASLLGATPEAVAASSEREVRTAIASEIVSAVDIGALAAAAFKPAGRWGRTTAAGGARALSSDALRKSRWIEDVVARASAIAGAK